MTEEQRYEQAWRDQQGRRPALIGGIAFLFVYLIVFNVIWPLPRSEQLTNAFFAGVWAWAAIFLFLGIRLATFHCPRCGKFFALSRHFHAYKRKTAASCIHCQLPVGAGPDGKVKG
jgi:hypothetical protein